MLITSATLYAFVGASIVIYLMPGPDMAYIAANAIQGGRRRGLWAAAGTVSGVVFQAALAAIGRNGDFSALAHRLRNHPLVRRCLSGLAGHQDIAIAARSA